MLSWPNKNLRFKTLWGGIYDNWNYIIEVYQMQMEDMRAWWPTWDIRHCQLVHNCWNIFDSYQMQFKDKINNGYFWGIYQLDIQFYKQYKHGHAHIKHMIKIFIILVTSLQHKQIILYNKYFSALFWMLGSSRNN